MKAPKFNRIVLIVLDSCGVGALPDADKFGDVGANTLKNTNENLKGLKMPNFKKLGLFNLIDGAEAATRTSSFFGRMREVSNGKDTTTGHWEMMALPLKQAMSHFPNGFPPELMATWSKTTGCGFLGNKPASGTVIIDELGAEHLKTKNPIVYTSADSVFQIAAHEEAFGLEKLYELCAQTRKILDESTHKVGRVIARPFLGKPGHFKRTQNRRDFSLHPPDQTVLNILKDQGTDVWGIGKIPYIFDFEGITKSLEAHNDDEAISATVTALKDLKSGLIFTNLNDLDMLYGHRRDAKGYGHHLEWIDSEFPKILSALRQDDCLIVTADHGNDPTFKGTDHTREYVPLLIHSPRFGAEVSAENRRLKDRETFSDIGQSLLDNFGAPAAQHGKSFLDLLA